MHHQVPADINILPQIAVTKIFMLNRKNALELIDSTHHRTIWQIHCTTNSLYKLHSLDKYSLNKAKASLLANQLADYLVNWEKQK